MNTYSRRFTIEETFRDTKDITFGMGLSSTHIRDSKKRARLLLLLAMAHTLLTLLGVAGEECGLDRTLKMSTSKRRTISLFNQGVLWYRALGAPVGQNLAILQTLVATCKLHNVNPYDYLVDILVRLQTHPRSRIAELLPMNWASAATN